MLDRLIAALPQVLQHAPVTKRGAVQERVVLLCQSLAGKFALLDYVNFKGEGLNPLERYQGIGWGLLQVLLEMRQVADDDVVKEFSLAAERVLRRRVDLSPHRRNEKLWLNGWVLRVKKYVTFGTCQGKSP